MHRVTAATSLHEYTQNRALFKLLLNRSAVNSGNSRVNRMEAWSRVDAREKVFSDGKYHSSFVYTSTYTLLKCQGAQHTALQLRCTPWKQTTDSSTKNHWITSSQVEMAAFKGNQNKLLQHNFFFCWHFQHAVESLLPAPTAPHQLCTSQKEAKGCLPSPGTGKGCKQTAAACGFVLTPGYNFLKVRRGLFLHNVSKVTDGSTRKQIQSDRKVNCSSLSFSSDACIQTASGRWHYVTKSDSWHFSA